MAPWVHFLIRCHWFCFDWEAIGSQPHLIIDPTCPFLSCVWLRIWIKRQLGQRECVSSRFYFEKIEINSKIVLNINLFYVFNSLIKHIYVFYIYICSISYINSIFKSAYLNCPQPKTSQSSIPCKILITLMWWLFCRSREKINAFRLRVFQYFYMIYESLLFV